MATVSFGYSVCSGYEEEQVIYDRIQEKKHLSSLDWIDKSPKLKSFLKTIKEEDFSDDEKRETIRIALFEALGWICKL